MQKTLFEIINESVFGIFTNLGYLEEGNLLLEIKRIITKDKNGYTARLVVKNLSSKPINIYSFLIADLLIPEDYEISEVLENSWLQSGLSYYKKVKNSTKRSRFFLKLNQNPHSFENKYGYLEKSLISEWYSVLKGKNKCFIFGAITIEDQFSQVYTRKEGEGVRVRLTSQYDGLELLPNNTIESETFYIAKGEEYDIKKRFAHSLADTNNIKSVSESISAICMSYYWNSNFINQSIINSELDVLEGFSKRINLDYIQLDAGYSSNFGDWLDFKSNFPNGLLPIIKRIKRMNYKAGVWIAPILAGRYSEVHKNHKGWILHLSYRKHLKGLFITPFDRFIKSINLDILDITNEEVIGYIKTSLRELVHLGFGLFKIDFVYPLGFANHFSKKVTRAQAVRGLMKLIRSVVGENKVLSGMVPLSPVVGLVDYVRTGVDSLFPHLPPVLKSLVNNYMLKANTQTSLEREFLNGIVWRADPDVVVFTDKSGISKKLREDHMRMVLSKKMSRWMGEHLSGMDKTSLKKVSDFLNK